MDDKQKKRDKIIRTLLDKGYPNLTKREQRQLDNALNNSRKKIYEELAKSSVEARIKAERECEKIEFENQLGIDFYNLNTNVINKIPSEIPLEGNDIREFNKLKEFFHNYAIGPDYFSYLNTIIPNHKNEKITKSVQEMANLIVNSEFPTFLGKLPREHIEYKKLVDKAISGEKPTEDELRFIENRFRLSISISWTNGDSVGTLIETNSIGIKAILGFSYRWLIRLWSGQIKARKCEASDCQRLFIPTPRGRDQIYCSDRCYKRTYMRKRRSQKKKMLV